MIVNVTWSHIIIIIIVCHAAAVAGNQIVAPDLAAARRLSCKTVALEVSKAYGGNIFEIRIMLAG